jgi:hypothetical protein
MSTTIESIVQEQLSHIDVSDLIESAIKEEVKKLISEDIKRFTKTFVEDTVKSSATELVAEYLSGPIKTDDGWGTRSEVVSFEEFFKREFKKQVTNDSVIKRTINEYMERITRDLVAEKRKEIMDNLTGFIESQKKQ